MTYTLQSELVKKNRKKGKLSKQHTGKQAQTHTHTHRPRTNNMIY